jgi:hypothetical protein
MHRRDLDMLGKVEEGLALLFYVLIFMAVVMALAGQAGSAFVSLLFGAAAHVGQAGVSEFVDRERTRGQRSRPEPRGEPATGAERRRRERRVAA